MASWPAKADSQSSYLSLRFRTHQSRIWKDLESEGGWPLAGCWLARCHGVMKEKAGSHTAESRATESSEDTAAIGWLPALSLMLQLMIVSYCTVLHISYLYVERSAAPCRHATPRHTAVARRAFPPRCPALPCPALLCLPALPCLVLLCLVLHCHALPCPTRFLALPCLAFFVIFCMASYYLPATPEAKKRQRRRSLAPGASCFSIGTNRKPEV